jgi:hypothetical protein
MKPLRVAVWSTGWIGSIAVQTIARRPDFELAGVWVHAAEKAGQDAGVLTGGEPLGVLATNDHEALLAERPDCICYAASDGGLNEGVFEDYVRFLEAGVNVVTVTTAGLVFPPSFEQSQRIRLEEAARSGGATLYASGIEPGFAGDQLALTLLTMSRSVTSVRAQEIFLYDQYPVTFMMFDVFGFGKPMSYTPIMSMPGVQAATWAPVVRMVAHGLGAELDEVRETYERELTPRELHVAAGVIEAGTVGAVRLQTIGVVDGRDAIVVEHINRMAPDLAPQWATAERDGTYRIVIEGDPSLQCELVLGASNETASAEGMVATAMRIVNAIPGVCAALPGLVSSLDLPLTLPRNALG